MERFEAVTSTPCSAYICMDRNTSDVYALAPCCGLTISENRVDHKVLDSSKLSQFVRAARGIVYKEVHELQLRCKNRHARNPDFIVSRAQC